MAICRNLITDEQGDFLNIDNGKMAVTDTTAQGSLASINTIVTAADDSITGSINVVDYEHHEIHSGSYFRAGFQKDIASGGTATFAITTPDTTKWLHFRPAVDTELEATIMLYENPTSITGGSAVTPRNANRNSINTSGASCVSDCTYNATGAIVLGNQVLGSKKDAGGNGESQFEWVLKQNTIYLLVVINDATGATNECNIKCQWYEHTNK